MRSKTDKFYKCEYHLHSVICIRDRTAVVIHTANLPRVGNGESLSPPGAAFRDPCQGQTSGHVVVYINPRPLKYTDKIYGLRGYPNDQRIRSTAERSWIIATGQIGLPI